MPDEPRIYTSEDPQRHPLIRRVPVVTSPIKEVYRQIKFMLVCGDDSRCFGAFTQGGKSQALKVIERWLRADFPNILFIKLLVTNTAGPTSNENLVNLASTLPGCRKTGTAYVLRTAITNALKNKVIDEGWIKVVLLLDEGQCLTMHEFEFLKDLYNALWEIDIHLATVVFGQEPQLRRRLKDLLGHQRDDLVRRVLGSPRAFRDLLVPSEVAEVFSAIDSASMPEMPELTWSQWFVPHAWAKHNWRLANETCNFAAAARDRGVLEVMEGETGKDSEQTETVVAGLLFGAVRHYFILLASDDVGEKYPFPAIRWKEAIVGALQEIGGRGANAPINVTLRN